MVWKIFEDWDFFRHNQFNCLCYFSKQYNFLIGRAFQGISSALICCSINLILYLQLSGEDFGKSIGIVLSAGYVGLALSYLFAGIITYYLSWRILFLSLMLLYIVAFFILMKLDKEWFLKKDISIDSRPFRLRLAGSCGHGPEYSRRSIQGRKRRCI